MEAVTDEKTRDELNCPLGFQTIPSWLCQRTGKSPTGARVNVAVMLFSPSFIVITVTDVFVERLWCPAVGLPLAFCG